MPSPAISAPTGSILATSQATMPVGGCRRSSATPPMAIDASSAKMVRRGPNSSWFSSPPTTSTRMMRSSSPAPRLFADSSASNRIQRSHNAHEQKSTHEYKKGPRPPRTGPSPKNKCGSHLLSHNHQVAVPSARMGLATGIGTVNRAFPHHYHHRKTNRPPHPTHQSGGSSPRTAQRTRTPQTMQPPHTKRVVPPPSTPHTHAHTNPKRSMSDRCISTSQLHPLLPFHAWPINPIIYRPPLPTQMWAGNLIS